MTIDDKIRYEKLQCNVNREVAKWQHCHQVKLKNMNILLENRYYHLIKVQ